MDCQQASSERSVQVSKHCALQMYSGCRHVGECKLAQGYSVVSAIVNFNVAVMTDGDLLPVEASHYPFETLYLFPELPNALYVVHCHSVVTLTYNAW